MVISRNPHISWWKHSGTSWKVLIFGILANPRLSSRSDKTLPHEISFNQMEHLLINSSLSLDAQYRFVKCCICWIVQCGIESWTLSLRSKSVMWIILRISWVKHSTSKTVTQKMYKDWDIISIVKKLKQATLVTYAEKEKNITSSN